MTWIEVIPPAAAGGELHDVYDRILSPEGRREATGQRPTGIRDGRNAHEREPQIWEYSERTVHFDVELPPHAVIAVTLEFVDNGDQE